jgi:hypothetical protein
MAQAKGTEEAIESTRREIDQATAQMRTQVAAFRRTAAPEIRASYLRIAAEIGREDPFVTGRLGQHGISDLIEELELISWDIPQLLDGSFTEEWMQACFSANGIWPDDPGARVYDYLRGRGKAAESPFPEYFLQEL